MENAINNNIQLQNEGDIFQYIEIEDEIFGFNYEHNANENTTNFIYNKTKSLRRHRSLCLDSSFFMSYLN